MSPPKSCDVVVAGAGLAGLACAVRLRQAGLDVQVLEASDGVGGRVRTGRVGGFLADRGFQVLSTAYPEARRALDYERLDLRRFDRAMLLHVDGETVRLADPLREPHTVPGAARAPIGGLGAKLALTAYAGVTATAPARLLKQRRDVAAADGWRAHKVHGKPVETVLRPFLAGVLLEHEMSTSRRFVDLMMRMFVRGWSAVPAGGMGAMPAQLAERVGAGSVHLGVRVGAVTAGSADTDAGQVGARAVVVATDADTAAALLPGAVEAVTWKGVTTIYHAAPEPPIPDATLLVDADASPVNNTLVVTNAAPSYAPDGRALVATSLVHGAGAENATEVDVRQRLATLYGVSTSAWEEVATYVVPHALPGMPAPHPFRRPVRVSGGDGPVYVCGDHRDTSSIQGALVSGRRAAEAVIADLGAG